MNLRKDKTMEITAQMVGTLRSKTGAGFIDCKKALVENKGSMEEAIVWLKKKGMLSAAQKANRTAQEGIVGSYIHLGGKLGVLVEVNCETDFVARNEEFKQMVSDICMHITAAAPIYLRREDVPQTVVDKEVEIAKAQCEGKPAQAIQKIVEGKMNKWFGENCLLEQPFVKNSEQTIQELLNEKIAKIGENIQIKRFARYQVGE
ncbi:MAG: translation elongation factor Ts [Puniceicoccales bacterium]|jgi:elongation factor Ts|nr:translation elongation factor Ts [Puniceicoccales bacterium]